MTTLKMESYWTSELPLWKHTNIFTVSRSFQVYNNVQLPEEHLYAIMANCDVTALNCVCGIEALSVKCFHICLIWANEIVLSLNWLTKLIWAKEVKVKNNKKHNVDPFSFLGSISKMIIW